MTEGRHELFALIRRRVPDASLIGLLRTFPGTILLVLVITLCGLVTQGDSWASFAPTLDRLGLSYDLLMKGNLHRVFMSTFVQSAPGIKISMVALIVTSFALCEMLAGTVRLFVTVFATDWFSSFATSFMLKGLSLLGSAHTIELLSTVDAGSSAAAHGAYAVAATLLLPRKLAAGALVLLMGVTGVLFLQQQLSASLAHFSSSIMGALLGWFVFRPRIYPEERTRTKT